MSVKLESWPSKIYSYSLPMRYFLWGPKEQGLVLCMHGYQDHALSMMRRIGWWEEEDLPFQVLALNAPFPVPFWTADGFKEAYAWYFRDTERGFTIVSPNEMADRVHLLLNDLGLVDKPIVIFGFSQGGYLAPFVGKLLPCLKAIISLGSGYPERPYSRLPLTTVYGIHGEKDERIPFAASRDAHAALLKQGFKGEFHGVPGLTHKVHVQIEPLVRRLAVQALNEP